GAMGLRPSGVPETTRSRWPSAPWSTSSPDNRKYAWLSREPASSTVPPACTRRTVTRDANSTNCSSDSLPSGANPRRTSTSILLVIRTAHAHILPLHAGRPFCQDPGPPAANQSPKIALPRPWHCDCSVIFTYRYNLIPIPLLLYSSAPYSRATWSRATAWSRATDFCATGSCSAP